MPQVTAGVGHLTQQSYNYGYTDAAGTVFLTVAAGSGRVAAYNVFGLARADVDLARDSETQLDLILEPWKTAAMSVLSADVVPGTVSADGRSALISVTVAVPEEYYYSQDPLYPGNDGPPIELEVISDVSCAVRSGAQLADLGPGCVDAGDGSDRAWAWDGTTTLGSRRAWTGPAAGPVLLLLDRSQRAAEVDRYDVQLFAAKALASGLLGRHLVAVGAFAADGGPSGTASPLPQQPVTFFPVENPGWMSGRPEVLGALESLRGQAGGASALREAVRAGVDFLRARSGPADRPALVVFTSGAADECATASSCAAAAREISGLAQSAGVDLWLVGPGDTWGTGDGYWQPSPFLDLSRGPGVRYATMPFEAAAHAASELVRASLGGSAFVQEARFRIASDVPGTFAPGVTILGDLSFFDFVNSGMGIWQRLPFRATVPSE